MVFDTQLADRRSCVDPLDNFREADCFVAGTLVHTSTDLVPIEEIQVGDLVLSRHASQGEREYRRVISSATHQDREVVLLRYFTPQAEDVGPKSLVLTADHPVWVERGGWIRSGLLEGGYEMQLVDGSLAMVYEVRRILKSDVPNVGFTHDDVTFEGLTIDLQNMRVNVQDGAEDEVWKSALSRNEYLRRDVYRIGVEDFHTYYVAADGVWVHDANCDKR